MKRIIFSILCVLSVMIFTVTVYAADVGDPYLYPVNVKETQNDNGRREVIKTYELDATEKPDNISREPFTRDDWLYEFADITKKESNSIDTRNHTETVAINTDTNDAESILKQFAPTIEYTDTDGYSGVLSLDISSIKVEAAGIKSSVYAVTATRDYPNMSSNDTSFIPKEITENGRTLILSDVEWKVQNYSLIDNDIIPDGYTAIATYTGTAYKTVVTGYTTTAEYMGALTKNIIDKTIYVAYFTGIPIVFPTETQTEILPATEAAEETEPKISLIPDEIAARAPIIITGFAGLGLGGGLMYFIKKHKK